jgi:hypothetical protein
MKTWLAYSLAWLVICGLIGVLVTKYLGLSFWLGAGIAAAALVLNGLIAEIEDRAPGGLLHSDKSKNPPSDG